MTRTRLAPWLVLACIGTLAASCTSSEDGTAGNTELNVLIPNNESSPGIPGPIDIQSVEYTINCTGTPSQFLDNNTPLPNDGAVQINGNLEVDDGATPEIWQGYMDLPPGDCTVQLRARDNDGEVVCTGQELATIVADTTAQVNVVLVCQVAYQAPVGQLDVGGTFSFVVGNFCPDAFVLTCLDSNSAFEHAPAQVVPYCVLCNVPGIGAMALPATTVVTPQGPVTAGQNAKVRIQTSAVLALPGIAATVTVGAGGNGIYAVSGGAPPSFGIPVPEGVYMFDGSPNPVALNGGDGTRVIPVDAGASTLDVGLTGLTMNLSADLGGGVIIPLALGCATVDPSAPEVAGAAADLCTPAGLPPGPPLAASFAADGTGALVASTTCETRYRDVDNTCGQGCDPQVCTTTPEGLTCVPGPDPGVSTTVTAAHGLLDCDNNGVYDSTSCTYAGDSNGAVGAPGDAPLNGNFGVFCSEPGETITLTAVTTDGDVDCDKTRTYDILCPGATPCAAAGCTPGVDCALCDDANTCTSDVCVNAGGLATCPNSPLSSGTSCPDHTPQPGLCDGAGVCVAQGCNVDVDCEDANECTFAAPGTCQPDGSCLPLANEPATTACNTGTGSGIGECDGSGTCVSQDACQVPGDCPAPAECTVNTCTGAPLACGTANAANGTPCASVSGGACNNGVCEPPPVLASFSGTTTWRAEPTTGSGCTYDSVTTTCTGCTAVGPLVPGGGQCAQFGTPVIHGCEVPGGVLNAQLAIDVTVNITASSIGDGNVTTSVNVSATNPALSTAAGLVTVDAASIFTSATSGVPASLSNGLNPAFAGQVLGAFTGGGNILLLDNDPLTGIGIEMPDETVAFTPTSDPVAFNYDNFSVTLTITASGTPLIVDDAGCVFNFPGAPVNAAQAP